MDGIFGGAGGVTPLYAGSIPTEVRLLLRSIGDLPRDKIPQLIDFAISITPLTTGSFNSSAFNDAELIAISGFIKLIRAAKGMPNSLYSDESVLSLLREFKVSNENSSLILSYIRRHRQQGTQPLSRTHEQLAANWPTIRRCNWRLDVAISTESRLKALEPSVLMELELDDGTCKTFEMSLRAFHALRFNTALALEQLQRLERRNIVRLAE
jgi:hypothetical protein